MPGLRPRRPQRIGVSCSSLFPLERHCHPCSSGCQRWAAIPAYRSKDYNRESRVCAIVECRARVVGVEVSAVRNLAGYTRWPKFSLVGLAWLVAAAAQGGEARGVDYQIFVSNERSRDITIIDGGR